MCSTARRLPRSAGCSCSQAAMCWSWNGVACIHRTRCSSIRRTAIDDAYRDGTTSRLPSTRPRTKNVSGAAWCSRPVTSWVWSARHASRLVTWRCSWTAGRRIVVSTTSLGRPVLPPLARTSACGGTAARGGAPASAGRCPGGRRSSTVPSPATGTTRPRPAPRSSRRTAVRSRCGADGSTSTTGSAVRRAATSQSNAEAVRPAGTSTAHGPPARAATTSSRCCASRAVRRSRSRQTRVFPADPGSITNASADGMARAAARSARSTTDPGSGTRRTEPVISVPALSPPSHLPTPRPYAPAGRPPRRGAAGHRRPSRWRDAPPRLPRTRRGAPLR